MAQLKPINVFISHTKVDYEPTGMKGLLCSTLKEPKYKIFCSSDPDSGIEAGKKLHEVVNNLLKTSNVFIGIVTENYLRSQHCIYELSVMRFIYNSHVKPIIIYANKDIATRIENIADPEWISIFLDTEQELDEGTQKIVNTLNIPEASSNIKNFLQIVADAEIADRPYIGMSEKLYNDLLKYCQQEGIVKLNNGQLYTKEEIDIKFRTAKTVYIVSTTGAGLIKTLKEQALISALQNNATINVILPDRNSQFCKDVAAAECCREGFSDVIKTQNNYRIQAEFVATIQYLNEAYCIAKTKQHKEKRIGKILCYCSNTLLRQTIVLALSDSNPSRSWGWINMTMPPQRTNDTPSIGISDNNTKKGLDKEIIAHCECLMQVARQQGAYREINGESSSNKLFSPLPIIQYWQDKKASAELHMKSHQHTSKKILIEIAAQHPLDQGLYPNEEFKKRLDAALHIYKKMGKDNVWFYVPGSVHKYNGITDKISLSVAGENYLIKQGIERTHIFAEAANTKYKGNHGVFNSADECFVSSKIFNDNNFSKLICVCSPYQTMRKTFYYLEFGIIPICYGIPGENMYHDVITEYFGSLYDTVYEDHNWQDENSSAFLESRRERK